MRVSDTVDLRHILEKTKQLWPELRGAHVFITGGTGFLGLWLLRSFLLAVEDFDLRATITVLTRNPSKFAALYPQAASHPAVTLLTGDVRSFSYPKHAYTHVIHAAADSDAALIRERPQEIEETIVEGTRRTLEFAHKTGVSHFLFLSSGAVYGTQPQGMVLRMEDSALPAEDLHDDSLYAPYARAKRAAEELCNDAASSDFVTTVSRCFTFVGPNIPLNKHYALGNFIRDALAGGPITVRGDGTAERSYLHTADAAVWLWTILLKGVSRHPYNVGSEKLVTIAEVARIVAQMARAKPDVHILGNPKDSTSIDRYIPSTKRARLELGLHEIIGLPEAIRRIMGALE